MRILALALAAFLLAPVHTVLEGAAIIGVEGEGAKYWPRWRGPSGQGLAKGSGDVDKWCDTKNVKWKAKLDTTGKGGPIVWAGRIFLTIASADGEVLWKVLHGIAEVIPTYVPSPLLYGDELYTINDRTSVATAYDAKSGAVLWQGRVANWPSTASPRHRPAAVGK